MAREQASPPLTGRQAQILDVIREAVDERGYPPSVREIGAAVGLTSPSSVAHQLRVLESRGWLRRDPHRPRAIEVRGKRPIESAGRVDPEGPWTRSGDLDVARTVGVPLVGRIAAGGPILAEESIESVFPLPIDLVGKGDLFMLRVVGESMIDVAICDGDYVVVRRQPDAVPGEIVAAMIEDEATVKTFSRKDGHSWLLPANDAFRPIPADDARILGKVVSVMRRV